MANTLFIARIELHDVEHDHKAYEILHGKMADARFDQEAFVSGALQTMPRATYRLWTSDTKTTDEVSRVAVAALNSTIAECKSTNVHSHLNGSIYTIKSAEPPRAYNLKPVNPK